MRGGYADAPAEEGGRVSTVKLEVAGSEALKRAEVLLENIPGGVDAAMKAAMSRATAKVRSASVASIQEQYDIDAGNIRPNQAIRTRNRTRPGGVEATVVFSGKRIPLHRYNGAYPNVPTQDIKAGRKPVMVKGVWTRQYQGVAARGHQFKSTTPREFFTAFVARMKSGHIGIFERTGGVTSEGSDEIRELMGSSVPQMIGHETVSRKLAEEAYSTFEQNLDAAVLRILNAARGGRGR